MTVTREEYHDAIDRVHVDLIDVLAKWMSNEKGNLDSYIANPEGHILYSPFIKPDLVALGQRSQILAQVVVGLSIISDYKKGLATRSQHDYALDRIPHILFNRLLEWMENRYGDYAKIMHSSNVGIPISEYGELATFDKEAFAMQMAMYAVAIDGIRIVIEYKIEQEELAKYPNGGAGE